MSGRVVNLALHGIGPPPAHLPRSERETWVSREVLEQVVADAARRPDVALTFDDGNRSDVDVALPTLLAAGVKATFFVVADRIGSPGYLAENDIEELVRHGMGIGFHGAGHRAWRTLGAEELDAEMRARRALERAAGMRVRAAACPFGSYDRRVLATLRRHGFERVYTSDGGAAAGDRWLQPRTSLRCWDPPDVVDRLARRPASPAHRVKLAIKRWR